MRTNRPATPRLFALSIATLVIVLAGCSSGPGTLGRAEVESTAAEQLAATVESDVVPDISCPGDLEAEVGAAFVCELSVEGDDAVYEVDIEVTEMDGDRAHFDIQVADEPVRGG
ncbi:MAG: DUF4333 domain-containing protein [Actinomycetota bacterium]|nr:DUF4333 domain-containing protein [Actinomycetota bacterium]